MSIHLLPSSQINRRDVLAVAGLSALAATGLSLHRSAFAEDASPAAVEALQRDILFETNLPADTFKEDAYFAGYFISSMQPDSSATWDMKDQIAQTNYVFKGTLTLVKSGPGTILRKDGTIEEYGAEDTIVLNVGDTRVVTDLSRPQVYANTGTEANRWTYCPIGLPTEEEIEFTGEHLRDEWFAVMGDVEWAQAGLSAGDLTIRLEQVTMPVGSTMEIGPGGPPVMRIMDQGRLSREVTRLDGTVSEPFMMNIGVFPNLPGENIDHWTFTNSGDKECIIYEYSLIPATGSATPEA